MLKRTLLLKDLARWMLVLVAAALMLVACGSDDDASGDDQPAGSPPEAALAARDALAADLGLDAQDVIIESYEQVEWTDSCLGLGGPAESCLAAPHPGWQVMLEVDGVSYEVRTDETAEIIRFSQ